MSAVSGINKELALIVKEINDRKGVAEAILNGKPCEKADLYSSYKEIFQRAPEPYWEAKRTFEKLHTDVRSYLDFLQRALHNQFLRLDPWPGNPLPQKMQRIEFEINAILELNGRSGFLEHGDLHKAELREANRQLSTVHGLFNKIAESVLSFPTEIVGIVVRYGI